MLQPLTTSSQQVSSAPNSFEARSILRRSNAWPANFQAQLDSESPRHELSAAGAAERGMPALFVSLAHTVKAAMAGVKSEAALERRAETMRQASE